MSSGSWIPCVLIIPRFIQFMYMTNMERQFLKDEAEQNRVKGISLANEICKNYRREGLFFDEILENIKTGGREWMDYN